MTLESCDTVRVTKRYKELIPGLWTGNRERSWTGRRWHPWHVVYYQGVEGRWSSDTLPRLSLRNHQNTHTAWVPKFTLINTAPKLTF